MPEQAAQDTGPLDAAAAAPQAVEIAAAPSIAPDHEAPPKPDPVEPAPMAEAPRIVVPKISARPEDEAKPEPKAAPKPGKLIVMASSDHGWEREDFAPHVKADEARETGGKRRLSAMAAVVAIAACVRAVSGAPA